MGILQESVIVPFFIKGVMKQFIVIFLEILLLFTSFGIFSNILLAIVTLYTD